MDDLNEKLDRLLSDPELNEKLSGVLESLGVKAEEKPTDDPLEDLFGKVDLSAVASLLAAGDDGKRLLRALAPYLRPSRQKKMAQAEKILTVCRLLPVLTEHGDDPCGG